ncbi:MAG: hypothetical protein JOZ51_02935, partial [Chloroflexi bacterium]|nr:hypothetical protein [Chloroflexota bacterium]
MQRRFTDFAYRFRPDHPTEGLEFFSIASHAQKPYFSRNTPLEVVVWNTFKGKRESYYNVLAERTVNA